MTNIKNPKNKLSNLKASLLGQIIPHTVITMNWNTVLKHRTKTDAHNNSESTNRKVKLYLEYCIWDKNGFILIKAQKGKFKVLFWKISCYLVNSFLWNTAVISVNIANYRSLLMTLLMKNYIMNNPIYNIQKFLHLSAASAWIWDSCLQVSLNFYNIK